MSPLSALPRIRFGAGTVVLACLIGVVLWGALSSTLPFAYACGTSIGVALVVIASVALHEFGHALAVRACGGHVYEISVTFFGGHTRYNKGTIGPWGSVLVSIAGPGANIVLALLFSYAARLGDESSWFTSLNSAMHIAIFSFCLLASTMNWALALFNLLPGLPFDGGRVLESVLIACGVREYRATFITGWIGRLIALGLIVGALFPVLEGSAPFGLIWTLIIGWILFSGASEAIAHAKLLRKLSLINASSVSRPARTYAPSSLLADEASFIKAGGVYVGPDNRVYIPASEHALGDSLTAHGGLRLESVVSVGPVFVSIPASSDIKGIVSAIAQNKAHGAILASSDNNPEYVVRAEDLTRLIQEPHFV